MISDCELRPDEELSGLGGNLCFNHDLVESHRRSQSSSRSLQLRLRVAARQSVRPPHSLVLCGQPEIASRVCVILEKCRFRVSVKWLLITTLP